MDPKFLVNISLFNDLNLQRCASWGWEVAFAQWRLHALASVSLSRLGHRINLRAKQIEPCGRHCWRNHQIKDSTGLFWYASVILFRNTEQVMRPPQHICAIYGLLNFQPYFFDNILNQYERLDARYNRMRRVLAPGCQWILLPVKEGVSLIKISLTLIHSFSQQLKQQTKIASQLRWLTC